MSKRATHYYKKAIRRQYVEQYNMKIGTKRTQASQVDNKKVVRASIELRQ